MSTFGERLRLERKRLGFAQPEFGEIGGVARRAQINYEQGERSPDADYLTAVAAVGVDVLYVLTGNRNGPPPTTVSAEEEVLLEHYRAASKEVRRAALGALLGAQVGGLTQKNSAAGAVLVGSAGGRVSIKGRR